MEKVMIVDDNMANLIMAKKTLEEVYEVIPVSSGISAIECLNDMPELPDLVLLDVDMPNVNGFQVISEIKNKKKLVNIPIIFLTAQDDDVTELEGYNLGAVDYIKKPYNANLLKKRVDIQIQLINQQRKLAEYTSNLSSSVQEKVKRFVELQYSVVEMFVGMLEKKNAAMGQHAKRVEKDMEIFMGAIARQEKYGLTSDDSATISFASKIHDLGKLCISDKFLDGKGSNFENEALKTHTSAGADTISKITQLASNNSNFMTFALNMCRSHHENWDGSGYPDHLQGEKIPLEARALAIINTYDNLRYAAGPMTDGRKLTHNEAVMKLKFLKFTMFDPSLMEIFLACERELAAINP